MSLTISSTMKLCFEPIDFVVCGVVCVCVGRGGEEGVCVGGREAGGV